MSGETNLQTLLKNLKPELNTGSFVFVTGEKADLKLTVLDALLVFKEAEGITYIIEKEKADTLGLAYSFVSAWVTLKVHSALDAVGLTAAVVTALTKHNISCNVVAAFYHDHLFVAVKDAEKTMSVLKEFSA